LSFFTKMVGIEFIY